MARLDFLRFHRNRCISNGSDGLHRATFQPSSKYCLHFQFHLMTKLPVIRNWVSAVTQVDSTVLPVSFSEQTPSDSRFCPLESRLRFSSGIVERAKHERAWKSPRRVSSFLAWGVIFTRVSLALLSLKKKWGTTRSLTGIWSRVLDICAYLRPKPEKWDPIEGKKQKLRI